MENKLFETVLAETAPMYDAATITAENGVEYWHSPSCNLLNNAHSVTKFFIATSIGILVDRGVIRLNDPVTRFFPPFEMGEGVDPLWNTVTVYDALRHKTGMDTIPYNVDNDDCMAAIGPDYLKYVFSLKIEHTPGSYRRYSDEAYYLLGRIIHKASGMTAENFIKENIADPLGWKQWTMVKCPMGHTIGGGGLFARADDIASLAFVYANNGLREGKRMLSAAWINQAMRDDFACGQFRDTDIFLKTGAEGQCVAFSRLRPAAAAWHGFGGDNGKRNDRLLEGFTRFLDDRFGKIGPVDVITAMGPQDDPT